jgi:hypothetical protein
LRSLRFSYAAIALVVAACARPLPEAGSSSAQLYVARCGSCHRAYNPASMTSAMWQMQVKAMDVKMAQAGQPPLTLEQRAAILDYLERNAGKS